MKKGLAFSKSEKREGWRILSEEENKRESFRGFGFFFFLIFCLKETKREYRNRRVRSSVLVKLGEKVSREWVQRGELVFTLEEKGWSTVGPPWLFLLPYMYMYFYVFGLHE